MKKYLTILTLVLSVSTCFPVSALLAQEKTAQPAAYTTNEEAIEGAAEPVLGEEGTEFSYGTVKSISANQIVVSEYDYDTDKDVDVTYMVPAEAKLENVASLQEIAVGDAVDIDFLVKDGQKAASTITVEKPLQEDEDLALGLDEPKTDEEKTS